MSCCRKRSTATRIASAVTTNRSCEIFRRCRESNPRRAVTSLPSGWTWNWTEFTAEGKPPASPGDRPSVISQVVSPGFFSGAACSAAARAAAFRSGRAQCSSGRGHQRRHGASKLARPESLGKHIQMGRPEAGQPLRTIVGVVGDVQPDPLDHDPAPTAYVPFAQQPQTASAIVVRTAGDPLTLAGPVSKQLRDVDADQPPYDMRSLEQVVSDGLSGIESSANMMLIFAVCALISGGGRDLRRHGLLRHPTHP